jgi:hypothetical protein
LTQIEIFRFIEFPFVCAMAGPGSRLQVGTHVLLSTCRWIRENAMMRFSTNLMRTLILIFFAIEGLIAVAAQTVDQSKRPAGTDCRIEALDYKGWHGQQLSNEWVQLIVVPQNGGRLMQVSFDGHPYLFVNPKYAGKYLPPSSAQWFNYGGDKLWLLPEGNNDEQHWPGNSDLLDDGPFSFRILSQGQKCDIELTGPPDPHTGVQFVRTIGLDADSPRIRFHASMKNITGHTLEWSMQSVSQYDTAVSGAPGRMNNDFWTFAPVNQSSSYLNRYHVRFGPAENSAASVSTDGLFVLHYVHLAAELWLDSTAGWLAVVDGSTQHAMVERFRYDQNKPYPGKASVIFWTNGPEVKVNTGGTAMLSGGEEGVPPYYLEAEINSPLCRLRPGEACSLDTEWFPARSGSEFHGVTDAGIVLRPLRATRLPDGKVRLSGAFGVFFSGRLVAHFYDEHGSSLGMTAIADANPTRLAALDLDLSSPEKPARVSLHLEDGEGLDRGSLQEVQVGRAENH